MANTGEAGFTSKRDRAPRGVFRHGGGVWAIRYVCSLRHTHQERIGRLLGDAKDALDERRRRRRAGAMWCPVEERRRQQAEQERQDREQVPAAVFREYADCWLRDSTPHLKARTAEAYRTILDLHLIPAFGPRPLASLTPADVRSFAAEKLRAKIARNTVKNLVATLRTIGYQAVEDGLIPSNHAARFGKVFSVRHDPKAHVVALDEPGVGQVLAAAVKWFPEYELAVRTLFLTGMREGELLGLKWEDLDWPHNLIELRRSVAQRQGRLIVNTPKSGRLRTVDIPASLTARLRERFEVRQTAATVAGVPFSEWFFPAQTDPGKPMNDAWFRDRVWRKLLELAKVRHLRVHDARHTYASIMLRRGVPMAYVSRQLGHSSIQITVDLYGHFEAGADRHHVEGLAAAVDELETRAPAPDESRR